MPSSMNSTDSPTPRAEPASGGERRASTRRSISILFLIAVGLALVPVCLMSFSQAYLRLQRDRDVVRERLLESAQTASSEEQNVFAISEHVLNTVSLQREVRDGGENCHLALKALLIGLPFISNVARVSADGRILCAALPVDEEVRDLSGEAWWKGLDWSRPFSLAGPIYGPTSRRQILVGVVPLAAPNGARDGVLTAAIDLGWLDRTLKLRRLEEGAVVALLDPQGRVIASSSEGPLPAFHAPDADDPGAIVQAEDASGATWSYATAPLVEGALHIAFAMPDDRLYASTAWHVGADLVMPVAAILLASLAIWLVAHRWVIRPIDGLHALADDYAAGRYEARAPALDAAPAELAALGESLHAMAGQALDRDRRLQETLAQKALLVREVHHRVKNNLQIVVSLLSLQAGRLTDPEARAPLEQARTRISALALVHRLLLDMEEQSAVDMRHLMGELAQSLRQALGARARGIDLSVDIDDIRLPTDTAIPLTLFTVEAVTNAFRHAFSGRSGGHVAVTLKAAGGTAMLSIADDGSGFDPARTAQGTGLRLLRAFSQQLAGTLSLESAAGQPTTVAVSFPVPDAPTVEAAR